MIGIGVVVVLKYCLEDKEAGCSKVFIYRSGGAMEG